MKRSWIGFCLQLVVSVSIAACGGGQTGDGTADPQGATVTGRVLDSAGDPVADAAIAFAVGGATVHTDAGGVFQASLEPGTHRYTVTARGHEIASSTFAAAAGTPVQLGDLLPQVVFYATPRSWYRDADADGYSDGGVQLDDTQPDDRFLASALTATSGDCDDANAAVRPGAAEVCGNGIDEDCSGADAPCPLHWYKDADADGYSDGTTLIQVSQPLGYQLSAGLTSTSGDCDDANAAVHPDAAEVCGNGIDEDCSGADTLCALTWYEDTDADGYSDGTTLIQVSQPLGYRLAADLKATSGDCDDRNGSTYPGAVDVPGDDVDQDCDGVDYTVGDFADPQLEACVWEALGRPTGGIPADTLASITTLRCGRNVSDLTGIQRLRGLQLLQLSGNGLKDITPISGLTALQGLVLSWTSVSDLTPLSTLTAVQDLGLYGNLQLHDIAPLSELTALRALRVNLCGVADLPPLSQLKNLQVLELIGNQIIDITELSGLPALEKLYLSNNQITDVAPLSGLASLELLSLSSNSISDITPLSGLAALQVLLLDGNSVLDVMPLSHLAALQDLILSNNKIQDITPLSGLTALRYLDISYNYVSDVTALSGLWGLASVLAAGNCIPPDRFGPNPGGQQQFACGVGIRDPALDACVWEALGRPVGLISADVLVALTSLGCFDPQISDLTGLERLTGLKDLSIVGSQIQDLRPLTRLTALQYVDLSLNPVRDVGALAELVALQELYLLRGELLDITPLSGLTELRRLDLAENRISDVTPLSSLTGLLMLSIHGNCIGDLAPVTFVPNLFADPQRVSCDAAGSH